MRRFVVSRRTGVAALLALLILSPIVVRAHEHRTIAGGYDVLVGWDKEPPLVDQLNAASIAVTKNGQPVAGLEKTLKVNIAFGGNTPKEFPLTPSITQPGYYTVPIIPTRTGDYIFTFVGTIEGNQVNERFESGPNTFDAVDNGSDLQFPQAAPDAVALANQVAAAQMDAATARTIGIVGAVIGVLGLIAGGVALLRRPKA